MRLLFVLPEYGADARGGIGTFYAHLLPALAASGWEVDVCVASTQARPVPKRAPDYGITVRTVGPDAVARARLRLRHLLAVPAVSESLAVAYAAWDECGRGEGYDLVETTDFGLLFAPWLAHADGPPVVVQFHGSSGQVDFHDPMQGADLSGMFMRLLEAALLGRADDLQAYGPPNACEWQRLLARPVRVMLPCWAFAEPVRDMSPSVLPLTLDRSGLVVGRLQCWKGPEVLCTAMRRLGSQAPTVYWVGRDNPYRRADRFMSGQLRAQFPDVWGSTIVMAGEFPHAVVQELQRAARFVVVPSVWDTLNLSAVEAMAVGTVVVCSDGAGASDLVEHGANGFRFAAGDDAALAELLVVASQLSDHDRARLGAAARETVADRLSIAATLPPRLARYREVAATPRRREQSAWADALFASSDPPGTFGFLETLPLKPMLGHAARRILRKAVNRKA